MDAKQVGFLELLNGQLQYVVPRWQRRYRWGRPEIERLIEDLLTVAADKGPEAGHYGGTLLTFQEPGTAAGVVTTYRVVDGQQRLTTVSILLACVAEKLGPEGHCGQWTAQIIRDDRLTNPNKSPERLRKLRLQAGDEEEYRAILDGAVREGRQPASPGAVTQAWKTIHRLIARGDVDVAKLLLGLERLRVVSIGLDGKEDPQQIFESLNATGRPLTESEKVKNWLLIGLPDSQQRELHDSCWLAIEAALGAQHATEPVDIFLRDLLRWWTGELHGTDKVYEGLRRWAVRQGRAADRPALLKELARLAKLYGVLTGTGGEHPDKRVESQLRHLRELGIDVHRPLSLRLLNDAAADAGRAPTGMSNEVLARVLGGIGAWLTRLWLADRLVAGLNKSMTDIAHGHGPRSPGAVSDEGDVLSDYWFERIGALRNTQSAVPNDGEVREGIRTRQAYGARATTASFAVLCAMMEEEHREESPPREPLTVEHVMPQKLTDEWRLALGERADEIHGRYRNRLANLVLSGDATNSSLGAKGFEAKKQVYRNSSIGMTRRVADESSWDEEVLDRRAQDLADQALRLWPWSPAGQAVREAPSHAAQFKWRIDGGDWQVEDTLARVVLKVAGALITRDPANARRLSGDAITRDLQPASDFLEGSGKEPRARLQPVPGHEDFLLYAYHRDYSASARRCRKMGERCGVEVEVELADAGLAMEFWRFLKEHTGDGVPGQQDDWRGKTQRTGSLNADGDQVAIELGSEALSLYVVVSRGSRSPRERFERTERYSLAIREHMGEQDLGDDLEKHVREGKRTIAIQRRPWLLDDKDEWPEAAVWIKEQQERLAAILTQ